MTYEVVVTLRAREDLREYYTFTARLAPETALRWLNRFEMRLQLLSTNPELSPLAPESNLVQQTIRQAFFGKSVGRFRILFTIQNEQVIVLHIRRGTMDMASANDLAE